ncbi:hypothetical protein HDK64DRAFT_255181 [Phyllosticta capitalensis]
MAAYLANTSVATVARGPGRSLYRPSARCKALSNPASPSASSALAHAGPFPLSDPIVTSAAVRCSEYCGSAQGDAPIGWIVTELETGRQTWERLCGWTTVVDVTGFFLAGRIFLVQIDAGLVLVFILAVAIFAT